MTENELCEFQYLRYQVEEITAKAAADRLLLYIMLGIMVLLAAALITFILRLRSLRRAFEDDKKDQKLREAGRIKPSPAPGISGVPAVSGAGDAAPVPRESPVSSEPVPDTMPVNLSDEIMKLWRGERSSLSWRAADSGDFEEIQQVMVEARNDSEAYRSYPIVPAGGENENPCFVYVQDSEGRLKLFPVGRISDSSRFWKMANSKSIGLIFEIWQNGRIVWDEANPNANAVLNAFRESKAVPSYIKPATVRQEENRLVVEEKGEIIIL